MANKQFFVRSVDNGQIRTVMATTSRGAMRVFLERYNVPPGKYEIKERGGCCWVTFRAK